MKYETIKEAAQQWVHEFNAINQGMIAKLMQLEPDEWKEVTAPSIGDRVYTFSEGETGEIAKTRKRDGETVYKITLDNGKETKYLTPDEFEVDRYDLLPMWGTMWSFGDSADDWWMEEDNGIEKMSACGFRVYCSEEFGYFFGIDGAGYDFYEAHWIPVYKARGLQWHKTA